MRSSAAPAVRFTGKTVVVVVFVSRVATAAAAAAADKTTRRTEQSDRRASSRDRLRRTSLLHRSPKDRTGREYKKKKKTVKKSPRS